MNKNLLLENYYKSEFDNVVPLIDDDDALEAIWKKYYSFQSLLVKKGKNKKTSQKTVWVECVICNVHNMSHLLSIAAIDTPLRKMLKSSLNEEAFCP